MKPFIEINQLLHGYSDGHRLLRSSASLPSQAERLAFTMSDMSGPAIVAGFEDYLTGYPLRDVGSYSLARTWYAPEMRRPGCVYTQTLLLRFEDVERLSNLSVLLPLFRRPMLDEDLDPYSQRLVLDAESWNDSYPSGDPSQRPQIAHKDSSARWLDFDCDSTRSLLRDLLLALYGSAQPVFVPLPEANKGIERLILGLVSQQHPPLRRNFTFCTGSIASRSLLGRTFDLQVIPRRSIGQFRRELNDGTLVDAGMDAPRRQQAPSWLPLLLSDYGIPNRAFREFRDSVASQLKGTRPELAQLALAYSMAGMEADQATVGGLVETMLAVSEEEGESVKAAVLGADSVLQRRFQISESAILPLIVTARHGTERDGELLEVRGRARKLYSDHKKTALQTLSRLLKKPTELGEEYIRGICDVISPADLAQLGDMHADVTLAVIRNRPTILRDPEFWREEYALQRIGLDYLLKSADHQMVVGTIGTLLTAGQQFIGNELFTYGDRFVTPILEWINQEGARPETLPASWRHYLSANLDVVTTWLVSGQDVMSSQMYVLVSLIAQSYSPQVLGLQTELWLPAVQGSESISVSSFVLGIGLRKSDSAAEKLVKATFQQVHDAAARNQLGHHEWRNLDDVAPSTKLWGDWDKCERLRAALLDKCEKENWSVTTFLASIPDPVTLQETLELSRKSKKRKKYVTTVVSAAKQGQLQDIASEQLAVLRKQH